MDIKSDIDVESCVDVIDYASQIGRLDFMSALLGIVAIFIALAGVCAFFSIENTAKKEARKIAKGEAIKEAHGVAEITLLNFLDTELINILKEHNFNESLNPKDDLTADSLANSPDNDGGKL